jgi:DNA-binding NarL/FixJ family response regulator
MKRKIILVDDQPTFRFSIRNILEDAGDVEIIGEAADGYEFLQMLDYKMPEIVFMDIEMPRMNGIEATAKALEKKPNLVIIGLSLYENQTYVNQLIEAGAKGYLLKQSNNFNLYKHILRNPYSDFFYSDGISYQPRTGKMGKKTIAIVDDFETTTFTVEFALKNAGYEVIKAHTPLEILKYFDGRPIDMLISDYQMPQMLGHELVAKIKAIPNYSKMPVLMLSSEKSPEKQQLARDAGAFGWIQKPYDLKRFLSVIDKTLR